MQDPYLMALLSEMVKRTRREWTEERSEPRASPPGSLRTVLTLFSVLLKLWLLIRVSSPD